MDWGKVYFSKRHQICISCEPVHQLTQPEIKFPLRCAVNVLKKKWNGVTPAAFVFWSFTNRTLKDAIALIQEFSLFLQLGLKHAKFSSVWFHPTNHKPR